MQKAVRWVCVLAFFSFSSGGYADIAAIRAGALPQETAVLAALDDARAMEPYSSSFVSPWNFSVTKDEVASRLGKDLGFLRTASNAHPENPELLLLTGLVARYAYNVDVDKSFDTAMDVLGRAEKLAPADIRAPWFRSTLLCQTSQPQAGADGFLKIESAHPWQQLPAAFWDDYLACATVNSLPAHALRAADHLKSLKAPASELRNYLAEGAAKRFETVDLTRQYQPKEVWTAHEVGEGVDFTSTACGVRLRARGDWTVNQLLLNKGSCLAYFSTGPYQATKHKLNPSVMLMVQRAKDGESLEQYANRLIEHGTIDANGTTPCPVEQCLSFKANQPGMYGKDGDGAGRLVAFEREEPAFPGLALEAPHETPKPDPKEGVQYYVSNQVQRRMPGKLYYVVLLDVASSIEQAGIEDFNFFLKNLTVE